MSQPRPKVVLLPVRLTRHRDRASGIGRHNPATAHAYMTSPTNDSIDSVLSNADIAIGIVLALLLAGVASFLQGQRGQSDFVLGPLKVDADADEIPNSNVGVSATTTNVTVASERATSRSNATITTFEDWRDMSKPDNYIWYKTRLRQNSKREDDGLSSSVEQRWVLLALLALFVPIFSFEFFLTIGRQVICTIRQDWCLPYDGGGGGFT